MSDQVNPRRWLAVVAIGISVFLSALDGTIVALALPVIGGAFHLSNQLASAVMLAYAVPLALLVLPAGAVVSRFGARGLFVSAVAVFAAGTMLCGVAPTVIALLAGRVIQGAAAALLSTLGFAAAAAIVAPSERGRAMGIVGSLAPLGGIAGPGIGGIVLSHFGWGAVFFVNLPIAAAAVVLGAASLGGFRVGGPREAAAPGPGAPAQPARALLRNAVFRWSLGGFLASVTIGAGLYYLLPFDLQRVQGLAAAVSGNVLLCVPLGMGIAGVLAGVLADRYGPRPFAVSGAALALIAMLLILPVLTHPAPASGIAWRLVLLGVGMGLFGTSNQVLLMGAGGRASMGMASALSNLAARIGSVAGPLVVGVAWSLVPGLEAQMRVGGILVVALAILALAGAAMAARRAPGGQKPAGASAG